MSFKLGVIREKLLFLRKFQNRQETVCKSHWKYIIEVLSLYHTFKKRISFTWERKPFSFSRDFLPILCQRATSHPKIYNPEQEWNWIPDPVHCIDEHLFIHFFPDQECLFNKSQTEKHLLDVVKSLFQCSSQSSRTH